MKVLRLHGVRDLRLNDELSPTLNKGEALVNVKAVGICGSDLHWFTDGAIGDAQLNHPLVLGHEFSGYTENGRRVAVDPAIPCRQCEFCLGGNPNLCEKVIFAGHDTTDGALREQLAWDERNLITIPESLTYTDAAMLEPLGVAIHAVDLAHLKPGMTIGVFGCGTIGLLILQLARLSGAKMTIVTDLLPHRLDFAISLGADLPISAMDRDEAAEIMVATKGRGVDVAFEVAGEQEAVDTAFETVIPGGKVILVGIPADNRTVFTASTARRKGLTIKLVRRMKNTYPRAIELIENRSVNVCSLVTHLFPLTNATEAFSVAQRREGVKVVIEL